LQCEKQLHGDVADAGAVPGAAQRVWAVAAAGLMILACMFPWK